MSERAHGAPIVNSVDLAGFDPADRATLEEALEMAEGRGWDAGQFAAAVFLDKTVLQRLYQGKYEGRVHEAVLDVRRWVEAERYTVLIPTDVTRQYELVLNSCRRYGRMGVIVARNGRGKTLTCSTWEQGQPAGSVVRVQVPSRCTRADLVRLLCQAVGIDVDAIKEPEQERQLSRKITSRQMLIIDEAGALVQARRATSPLRLLQDLHDTRRCPVVLVMRPSQWSQLVAGRGFRDDEQLIGRLLYRCIVPDRWFRAEVESIVGRFTERVTEKLRTAVRASLGSDDGGLRALVPDLANAQQFSAAAGVPFETAYVDASAHRSRGGDWDPSRNPSF